MRITPSGIYIPSNFVAGDLVYGVSGNVGARLALGAKGRGLLAGASAPIYEPIARKNRLINGAMLVSQRGTTPATMVDNTYQASDRWRSLNGTTSGTAPAISQTAGFGFVNASQRSMQLQSQGGTGKFGIIQMIENANCGDLRSAVVSLQAFFSVSASVGDVRMAVLEWTGTADAISADPISAWNAAGTNPTLIAGWAYLGTPVNLAVTAGVNKVEGLTVGGSMNNLAVFIWSDDVTITTNDIIIVTDVQLEEGSVCTKFERIPYPQELVNCERYYEVVGNGTIGFANTASQMYSIQIFKTIKRVAPTLTLAQTVIGYIHPGVEAGSSAASTFAGASATVDAYTAHVNGFTGLTLSRPYFLTTAYIAANAEL